MNARAFAIDDFYATNKWMPVWRRDGFSSLLSHLESDDFKGKPVCDAVARDQYQNDGPSAGY